MGRPMVLSASSQPGARHGDAEPQHQAVFAGEGPPRGDDVVLEGVAVLRIELPDRGGERCAADVLPEEWSRWGQLQRPRVAPNGDVREAGSAEQVVDLSRLVEGEHLVDEARSLWSHVSRERAGEDGEDLGCRAGDVQHDATPGLEQATHLAKG